MIVSRGECYCPGYHRHVSGSCDLWKVENHKNVVRTICFDEQVWTERLRRDLEQRNISKIFMRSETCNWRDRYIFNGVRQTRSETCSLRQYSIRHKYYLLPPHLAISRCIVTNVWPSHHIQSLYSRWLRPFSLHHTSINRQTAPNLSLPVRYVTDQDCATKILKESTQLSSNGSRSLFDTTYAAAPNHHGCSRPRMSV